MNPVAANPGAFAQSDNWFSGVHIARVVDVADPESRGRVQVVIPAIDIAGEAPIWARVAAPYAGDNYGAFFIPDVDSEVLVAFTAGDATHPVVIGNLWNGSAAPPEETPSDEVKLWSLTGKNGTRIAIVEDEAGSEKVEITTPNNAKVTLQEGSGGKVKLKGAGSTITLSSGGIKVKTGGEVTVEGSTMSVTAGTLSVDCAFSDFSGIINCDMLVTNSVISSSYTPGAGNVW